jgi:hypothetical protein
MHVDRINEIGDSSVPAFRWQPPIDIDMVLRQAGAEARDRYDRKEVIRAQGGSVKPEPVKIIYTFFNDSEDRYVAVFSGNVKYDPRPVYVPGEKQILYESDWSLSFNLAEDFLAGVERTTNKGDLFRIMSTLGEIVKDFVGRLKISGYEISQIFIGARSDDSEMSTRPDASSRRSRLYREYLKKGIKGIPGTWSVLEPSAGSNDGFRIVPGNWYGSGVLKKESQGPSRPDSVLTYSDFLQEREIRSSLIKHLHECNRVPMIDLRKIPEDLALWESLSKYPELDRILTKAQKEGSNLLIADFVPEIEALVDKFSQSGQSGGSAPFTAGAIVETIRKMLAHEPLGDGVMCTDDEWNDLTIYGDEGGYQNNRLSSVFKAGKDGKPYYLNAIAFKPVDKDYTFTGHSVAMAEGSKEIIGSSQYIKSLPFQPKTFTIDVHEKEYRRSEDGTLVEEQGGGWWESWLADPKQLDEVWNYYDKKVKR